MKEINTKIRKETTHRGKLPLVGFKLPCFNLEDGRRLLSSNSIQVALKMVEKGGQKERGTNLKKILSQKSLKPFVDKEKGIRHFEPIVFYDKGVKINGYEATILPDICNIYLKLEKEAINQGKRLPTRQAIIAEQSRILLGAFAKVGIIALIDEATGYQKVRDEFELQKMLKAYISEETLEWQKTFHDSFYEQLYRL